MNDRDTFAAAALTGLLANEGEGPSLSATCVYAYRIADAMLALRDSRSAKETNHDAAPAARATADRYARRAAADVGSDRTDKAAPQPCEGTGDISEAQIDALECVVEDGRIVGMSVYGHLRSLLVRLRPEWEAGPDPDSRVWETPRTPPPPTTPPQGSVPDEGSVPDSGKWNEPVAWATFYPNGSTASVYIGRVPSHAAPLYRQPQPTLTDEERAAIRTAEGGYFAWKDDNGEGYSPERIAVTETLRKMLERLK